MPAAKKSPLRTVKPISGKKMITVVWEDACSRDEWQSVKDAPRAALCVSSGYFLGEDDSAVTVSHTISPNEDDIDTCCSLSIPKGCILEMYEIPCGPDALKRITAKVTPKKKR